VIRLRVALAALGLLAGLYGGWLLLSRGHDLVNVALWLVGGVVVHDAVLSVLVIALAALAVRAMPPPARLPTTVGFVVLGSATLFAIPVLGRFGARPDNPTLLDRGYLAGWLVLAGLTLVAVIVATLVRSRRR
jgi:hypothetical protein